MNGGVFLGVEVDPTRIAAPARDALPRRARADDLDEALRWSTSAGARSSARSIGLVGNAADVYPELVRRGVMPDLVTDQTSAHDPLTATSRRASRSTRRRRCARAIPRTYVRRVARVDGRPRRGDARDAGRRASRSTTATTCARRRELARRRPTRSTIPGFVPAYIRPLFCEGKGPFRWVALSAIRRTSASPTRPCSSVPGRRDLRRWIEAGAGARRVPGPAGAHLLARLRRARRSGCASTSWCARARSRRRS